MKNLGLLVLAVWLIATGLQDIVELRFRYDEIVLGAIAVPGAVRREDPGAETLGHPLRDRSDHDVPGQPVPLSHEEHAGALVSDRVEMPEFKEDDRNIGDRKIRQLQLSKASSFCHQCFCQNAEDLQNLPNSFRRSLLSTNALYSMMMSSSR